MKKLLILFLLISSLTVYAEDVVKYSGEEYQGCQSIGDSRVWLNDPNDIKTPKVGYLYFPNGCKSITSVDSRFLEVKDGKVLEKDQSSKDAIIASDALSAQTAKDLADSRFEVSLEEGIIALIQTINKRLPDGQKITKQEIIDQIKANR